MYLLGSLLAISVLILIGLGLYVWRISKDHEILRFELSKTVEMYTETRQLFDTASQESKESREKLQQMTELSGIKEVALTKGLIALQTSNVEMEKLLEQIRLRDGDIKTLKETVEFQNLQYDKLFGQKKSSEVRTGKIVEQVAPFLADYPLNPRTARFIGDPIDFVHFDEDKVTFIEVKSGKSQLSKKQRMIRDLINDKKVEFKIYRISGNDTN